MPRNIYNEGRVVGYSAYEIYVRHALSVDSNHAPASEKEWLASMMAMGSSMLLRVGTDNITGAHYRDVQLPNDTRLCAANNIVGSLFLGAGHVEGTVTDATTAWATKVTDYGPLIQNNGTSSPSGTVGPTGTIPPTDTSVDLSAYQGQIKSYLGIVDGVMIQPGTWTPNSNGDPAKDFVPTLSEYPRLRIAFNGPVTTPFFLLLTGFTNRTVVDGVTGFSSAVNTQSPDDGDFLGPWEFPWSAKVTFSVPAAYVNYYMTSKYSRELPSASTNVTVDSDPIIDMSASNPSQYYTETAHTDAAISVDVNVLNTIGASAAVLATYQPYNVLPPALYGFKPTAVGDGQSMYPIDSVAPGSLHLYHGDMESTHALSPVQLGDALESQAPGARAFMRDEISYVVNQLDMDTGSVLPVANVFTNSLFGALVFTEMTNLCFTVEGTYPRAGVIVNKRSGYNDAKSLFSVENLPYWYITYQGQNIEGTVVAVDPLPYCPVGIIMHKRITGKLSNTIKNTCGYLYNSSVFDANGIWHAANRNMDEQIPAESVAEYYDLIPGGGISNQPTWPVRKSDNMIDVTVKQGVSIYVNGHIWAVPSFVNDASVTRNSDFLGSWWGGDNVSGLSADEKSATGYANGWAKIHIDGHTHPTAKSALVNSTSQVYQYKSLLPRNFNTLYDSTTMQTLFGDELAAAGIKEEFRALTITQFLKKAVYTDMGTGEVLANNNPNITMPVSILSNGGTYQPDTHVANDIHVVFTLNQHNTVASEGKSQFIQLPAEYVDTDTTDPLGVVTQTGRLQALSLSMANSDNVPYSIYGTAGTIAPSDSNVSWENILLALSTNKKLDVLGDVLRGLKLHVDDSGTQYIQMKNSPRLYIASSEPTGAIPDGSIGIGW